MSGRFLLAPRDAYEVFWLNPAPTGPDTLELFISRDVPRVEVSAAERAARREETYASIEAYAASRDPRPDIDLEVPEVPAVKPYLRGLISMHDGGVMVMVSVPSVERPDGWVEPDVRDIFDREGRFIGRLEIPDGHWLFAERDGVVWTVYTDEMGVQSVHRHAFPF